MMAVSRLSTNGNRVLIVIALAWLAAACLIWQPSSSIDVDDGNLPQLVREQFDEMRRHPTDDQGERAFDNFDRLLKAHSNLPRTELPGSNAPLLFSVHLSGERYARRVINAIVDKGGQVDVADRDGDTPLSRAIELGSTETVLALLDRGADVQRIPWVAGYIPTHYVAVARGDLKLVEALLDHGAVVTTGAPKWNAAINTACGTTAVKHRTRTAREMIAMIDLLLHYGADLNGERDIDGHRPDPLVPINVALTYGNFWAAEHLATMPDLDIPNALRLVRLHRSPRPTDSLAVEQIIELLEARLAQPPVEN